MPKLTINTFEELESLLRNYINFHKEGVGVYDFIGVMLLLKACLENLRRYSLEADFEQLEMFFSDEEVSFLEEIIRKVKQ